MDYLINHNDANRLRFVFSQAFYKKGDKCLIENSTPIYRITKIPSSEIQ